MHKSPLLMKKPLLFIFALLGTGLYAQEHFSGISTSRRTGLLNASLNPAELTNLKNNYEVNIFNFSVNASNNKVSIGDLIGNEEDFEDLIFSGDEAVNLRLDVEILGPAFAWKMDKWAFAVTSAAKLKGNVRDLDVNFGSALLDDLNINSTLPIPINARYNQRLNATTWGEIGLSAARDIYNSEEHKISGGITFKLLFPGSYANMSVDKFRGQLDVVTDVDSENLGDVVVYDASANLNIAYSGSLGEGFTDVGNFSDFFGGLNGMSADIGFNYQWKDTTSTGYKINAGLALRNMGSMKFKDDNNVSNNYNLLVPETTADGGLNLSQFEDVDDLEEIEDILLQSGYVTQTQASKDFKVKLPASLTAYADVKLYGKWFATAFIQQKLNEDDKNDQIGIQNIVSLTPRYSSDWFEAYVPLSHNEIAGFTAGVGFRLGGFFIGSGSAISAAISDAKQADAYMGFRWGF